MDWAGRRSLVPGDQRINWGAGGRTSIYLSVSHLNTALFVCINRMRPIISVRWGWLPFTRHIPTIHLSIVDQIVKTYLRPTWHYGLLVQNPSSSTFGKSWLCKMQSRGAKELIINSSRLLVKPFHRLSTIIYVSFSPTDIARTSSRIHPRVQGRPRWGGTQSKCVKR